LTNEKIKLYPLNQSLIKYIIIVFVLIFNVEGNKLFAQSLVNFGAKIGGSKLLGELPKGESGIINEFDNKIGLASAFEISKYFSPRWEIGIDFMFSNLKGSTSNPDFSAEGVQGGIPDIISDPVEYENKLIGQNIFFRYYIKPANSEGIFIPFVKAGGGYLNYYSKFKYIDAPDNDLLFGKGKEGYTDLSTPLFFLGTGFKSTISEKFYILTSVDFNIVSYDFLDVVHNYAEDKSRLDINGLFTEIKIGIFYTISGPERKKEKEKKTKSKKGSSSKSTYLPFSR
jgi:hypothetical protein